MNFQDLILTDALLIVLVTLVTVLITISINREKKRDTSTPIVASYIAYFADGRNLLGQFSFIGVSELNDDTLVRMKQIIANDITQGHEKLIIDVIIISFLNVEGI